MIGGALRSVPYRQLGRATPGLLGTAEQLPTQAQGPACWRRRPKKCRPGGVDRYADCEFAADETVIDMDGDPTSTPPSAQLLVAAARRKFVASASSAAPQPHPLAARPRPLTGMLLPTPTRANDST